MRIVICLCLTLLFSSSILQAGNIETADKQPGTTTHLTRDSAAEALKGIQGEVVSVSPSEVPGFFSVAMKMQGKVIPIYLDATGSYLFSGNIIRLKDRTNLTEERFRQLNPVDISKIPLADALTLGLPDAKQQVLVFTDPHCPFCSKLHKVLLEAIAINPDLGFQIKLTPLKQSSKKIARTILCNNSMEQLEMAFSGQSLPEPDCDTEAIEANLDLARELGINGTPTLILPNGQIAPGYRPLEELLKLIDDNPAIPQ